MIDNSKMIITEKNTKWGRLLPITSSLKDTDLDQNSHLLGSGSSCEIKIEDGSIADVVCQFSWDSKISKASIMLLHKDSTLKINNKTVKEFQKVIIDNGDHISFNSQKKSKNPKFLEYIFLAELPIKKEMNPPSIGDENEIKTDMMEEGGQIIDRKLKKGLKNSEGDASNSNATSSTNNKLRDQFNCGICLDTIYNCVSLIPCLHNFCGACASGWLDVKKECPICKASVLRVKRNAAINSLIEENCPREQTAEEKEQMDSLDKLKDEVEIIISGPGSRSRNRRVTTARRVATTTRTARQLRRQRPQLQLQQSQQQQSTNTSNSSSRSSSIDSSQVNVGCPECTTARTSDNHQCGANTAHIQCHSCDGHMPSRPSFQQSCLVCTRTFCSMYFGSCSGSIQLNELRYQSIPFRLGESQLRGNREELNVSPFPI